MAAQMVFKRYEMKYLLSGEQKERVLHAMAPYMQLDSYGRSIIRNIYYDTDTYRLIRTSLEKPIYKEKMRVRSYGAAKPEDTVFVELKKKYDSVVYKRRTHMTDRQAAEYLAGAASAPIHSHITEEMDYFLKFYKTLGPKVFLSYEREAFYTREPGEFRVTFDENILFRQEELSLASRIYGEALLEPGQTLMEIKTPGSIPLWMVRVLTEEKIHKTSFSKYGNAYQILFMREKGESIYA